MIKRLRLWLAILLVLALAMGPLNTGENQVRADITSCNVYITPSVLFANEQNELQFEIENTSADEAMWMLITPPSADYSIDDAEAGSWNAEASPGELILSGGLMEGGTTLFVTVTVSAANVDTAAAPWTIDMSHDPAGFDAHTCGGSVETSISLSGPDVTAPIISGVSVSGITSSQAVVTWTTNEPATSRVDYGVTTPTANLTDNSLVIQHSLTIGGLNAGTTYFYTIGATDSSNNSTTTAINSFTTLKAASTSPPPAVVPTGNNDQQPPTLTLNEGGGIYTDSPAFTGQAGDNVAVAKIEYSIDGGLNWLPAESVNGLGTTTVSFSFTPVIIEDGDYMVVVRATDNSNNTVVSETRVVTIDRQKPLVGGVVLYLGSQPLFPETSGVIQAITESEIEVSLNVVGGATVVDVQALKDGKKTNAQSFSLAKSSIGLWTGKMKFVEAGEYVLRAVTRDGAGNTASRSIVTVIVRPAARVTAGNQAIESATVSVYYQNADTKTWELWDGPAYSQSNPRVTPADGGYSFFLPEGKYYLKASASSYSDALSHIFELDKPTVVGVDIMLNKRPGFSIGGINIRLPWPNFRPSFNALSEEKIEGNNLASQPTPEFTLSKTDGSTVSSVSLLGKPTVLSIVSTWSSAARQQIANLDKLSNDQINIVVVSSGESSAKLSTYAKLSGFDEGFVIDEDNKLINGLPSGILPTTYFIDRSGEIKAVSNRLLSEQEILNGVAL